MQHAPSCAPALWRYALRVSALLLLVGTHAAASPDPVWHVKDAVVRAVCQPPNFHRGSLLVTIPLPDNLDPDAFHCVAVDAEGSRLPTVTHPTRSSPAIWASIDNLNRRETTEFLIYAIPNNTPPAAPPARSPSGDVAVSYTPLQGGSAPNSWERFRYMFARPRQVGRHYPHTGFTPFNIPQPSYQSTQDERTRRHIQRMANQPKLCLLESWVNCPESGSYVFAVQSDAETFLLVDGAPVISHVPGNGAPTTTNDWGTTASVTLDAGPAHIQLFSVGIKTTSATLGWSLPSQHDTPILAPIPADLCMGGVRPTGTRIEWRDQLLHPGAIITAEKTYRFLECPTVFTPLTIQNWSVSWAAGRCESHWFANGNLLPLDPETGGLAILPSQDATALELFTIDPLGFHRTSRITPPASLAVPVEYAIDLSVGNIPAVCYAEDAIWPELQIIGSVHHAIEAAVTWRIHRAGSQKPQSHTTPIRNISLNRMDLPLPRLEVGDIAHIDWEITHAGVIIKRGTVRFLSPPFASLPASVHEETLRNAKGEQIVLVPHRFAGDYTQPPIHLSHAFGTLLCIDDQITAESPDTTPYTSALARLLDGPDRPLVSLIHPPTAQQPHSTAYRPLLKFPWLAAQPASHDVLILSLGALDLRSLPDVETFERHAAAISDLLATTRGQRMIWVTPPPPHDATFPIRPYAAAIQRVADARRIPVADLFSACLSHSGGSTRPHSSSAELPPELQELAASVVARAMLANTPPTANPLTRLIP